MILPKIKERFDPITIAFRHTITNWGFNFRPRYFFRNNENNHYIVIIDLIFEDREKVHTIRNIGNIIINEVAEIIICSKQTYIDEKIRRYCSKHEICIQISK